MLTVSVQALSLVGSALPDGPPSLLALGHVKQRAVTHQDGMVLPLEQSSECAVNMIMPHEFQKF